MVPRTPRTLLVAPPVPAPNYSSLVLSLDFKYSIPTNFEDLHAWISMCNLPDHPG